MNALSNAVDKYRELILETERHIWNNPETGYKEVKTSKYMADIFEDLGYELIMAEGIPGFYTTVDTGRCGPTILILGEMDSVICPEHPECNKETGAVHSCGHHAQCAALVGIAAALKEPGVLEKFCGRIKLCAVPAEELLEIEFRNDLKNKGIIKFFKGKSEFLSRGYFDDVDIAFMIHTSLGFAVTGGAVGCVTKQITYRGRASHAGGSPWDGINALYAATNGINAINSIRETFQEKDIIRVHPIMTQGGTMVNAIPETAKLESYVRGASFECIIDANKKVNRALCGAAVSLGANIDINDFPGYAPLINDRKLMQIAREAMEMTVLDKEILYTEAMGSGSTDMGDLCCVMPVVHPYAGGAKGTTHGRDYYIEDPEAACVESAKIQLAMLKILLENDAEKANKIIDEYEPVFSSVKEYCAYMNSLVSSGERIEYREDGTTIIKVY